LIDVLARLHAFSAARDSTALSDPLRAMPELKYRIALCC
jgi:hypothetical protein